MKFSTRVDVDAAIDDAFRVTTDFDRLERKIKKNGIKLSRLTDQSVVQPGTKWRADFKYRGKERQIIVELVKMEPPEVLEFQGAGSSGIDMNCIITFIKLSATKCRMKVGLEITPKSIPSRLLIRSMKLAKNNLNKRFAERVASFGKEIAARCRQ